MLYDDMGLNVLGCRADIIIRDRVLLYVHRDLVRAADKELEPRTAASTFTQLLSK